MTEGSNPPVVELFTQAHCASCRGVERYLEKRGVPFMVRRVDEEPAALEALAARGFMGTPVTRVGDRWIAGDRRRQLDRALREIGS